VQRKITGGGFDSIPFLIFCRNTELLKHWPLYDTKPLIRKKNCETPTDCILKVMITSPDFLLLIILYCDYYFTIINTILCS
jgi:hypothetical protein